MMEKEKLKEIILSNREFIDKEVKYIIKRENVSLPKRLNKVVIFYGVRRSGKTFVLFDLFKKYYNKSLYIDFEDDRLINFSANDFEILKESFNELFPHLLNKNKCFFLDEVQHINGWEKFCRRAVERENINVFVAGSSSKIMPLEIYTTLRGREWSIAITPFSFKEYLLAKGVILSNDYLYGSKKVILKNHFSEYMKWGGFPEVTLLENDFEKKKLLDEYIAAMFFKDLVERFNMTNKSLLDKLTDKLFTSFGQKLSLNAFYNQYKGKFPFSTDSLYEYYKNFINSMLTFEIKIFSESTYRRQRNPAKIYVVDPGLVRRVTSEDKGRILENIVFLELRKKAENIFYYSEKGECDFVVKKDNNFFPYQACFELNEKNRKREIDGLVECCNRLGKMEGVILTNDQEKIIKVESVNIKVLPVWKWLLRRRK